MPTRATTEMRAVSSTMGPPMQYPSASSSSRGPRRSGYEPSDTESEWNDSPWHDADGGGGASATLTAPPRSRSTPPAGAIRQTAAHPRSRSPLESNGATSALRASRKPSPLPRTLSRLPPEPAAEQDEAAGRGGKNPARHDEHRQQRHASPYAAVPVPREEPRVVRGSSSRSQSQRMAPSRITDLTAKENGVGEHFYQVSRASESASGHKDQYDRSKSAPKPRAQPPPPPPPVNAAGRRGHQRHNPSASEIKEITNSAPALDDIFFSHHRAAARKNPVTDDGRHGGAAGAGVASDTNGNARRLEQQRHNRGEAFDKTAQMASANSAILSRTSAKRSSSHLVVSRNSIIGRSKDSDGTSDVGNGSSTKFTAGRQKAHIESLFSCVKTGACRRSKSPDARAAQEACYIERATVVEELRQFWADKHRPRSLSGFICHREQAQQLQKLISSNNWSHIILKGPPGSGKRSLALALLHEIFGDSSEKVSHELKRFLVQENRSMVSVPLTSSPHHVELDIKSRTKSARYALMGLVKQMANTHGITPDVSDPSFKVEYKVMVLYANNKVAENIQHLMKWVMDCHTDICKIILCCEDEDHILESVRGRCKVISLDAPETHEVAEVLLQIAKKESFELSMGFATKIATKSRQNLRKAIMALESCKAYSYPFVDEQPIPVGWEEILVEIALEALADPSPRRLFYMRGKLQKVLVESAHPTLILQKLVEEFIKGVQPSCRRELYYWHAYYEKRLPAGTSALLKLEEFVAKFMSVQRRSLPDRNRVVL